MTTQKSFLSALLVAGIVVFSSCKKDDAPKVDPRDAFVGEYEMNFVCFDADDELEIEKDSKDAKIVILNSQVLEYIGIEDLEAEISGNEIIIEETDFDFIDPEDGTRYTGELTGDGKLKGKELTLELTLSADSGESDTCDVEGEKK
jgi:hypothetical protein